MTDGPTEEECIRVGKEAEEQCMSYAIIARKQGEEFFHTVKYTPQEQRLWYQAGLSRDGVNKAKKMLVEKGFDVVLVQSPGQIDLDQLLLYEGMKKYAAEKGIPFP